MQKTRPAMSVLMSVYIKDNPRHLKQALESIYDSQTVKPNEIVIVFDGPLTEKQLKVLNDFRKGKESIVHYYPQKTNLGLGAALQVGLKKCSNQFIARMDSDDISDKDRIKKQLAYINKHPNIDIFSSNIQEFDGEIGNKKGLRTVPTSQKDIVLFSRKRNPFNHMAVVLRKKAALDAGGYNETFHLFEDYYLWIRMLKNGCNAGNINEILVYMRTNDETIERRGGKEYAECLLQFHRWMRKSGWIGWSEYISSSIPHAVICIMPKVIRKQVYKKMRA